MIDLSIIMQRKSFFLQIWTYSAAMLARSFPMKSRRRLACDLLYTAATHAGFVHDVTDLVKMAALTAVVSRFFQTSIFNKLDSKSTEIVLSFFFFFLKIFHVCR